MLIKYNNYSEAQNKRFEQRVVLQSLEETIDMLRRRREDKKMIELMKEKSKLRNALYSL